MAITIKRERWKQKTKDIDKFSRFKFVVVVRDNGKLIQHKKYSKKESIRTARSNYKNNGSIIEGEKIKKITNQFAKNVGFSEHIREDLKKPRGRPFRVVAEALLTNKETIGASSQTARWGTVKEAKAEAKHRLYMVLDSTVSGGYDAEDGESQKGLISEISYSTVYYQ